MSGTRSHQRANQSLIRNDHKTRHGARTYVFASRRNRLLRLKFLAFELESGIAGERKGGGACAFDRLEMSDNGTDRVLCGDWQDDLARLEYVATSGSVALSFVTDFSGRYVGFKIEACTQLLKV